MATNLQKTVESKQLKIEKAKQRLSNFELRQAIKAEKAKVATERKRIVEGKREVRKIVVNENMKKAGKVQKTISFTRTASDGRQYTVTQKRWVKANKSKSKS